MSPNDPHELLAAYADGALDDEDRRAVENLLERSPAARAELGLLRETLDVVREVASAAAEAEPDWSSFDARLGGAFDAIDEERRDPSWRRWFRQWWTAPAFGAAVGALALLVLVIADGSPSGGAPTAQPPTPPGQTFARADDRAPSLFAADAPGLDPFADDAPGDDAPGLDPFADDALTADALGLDPFADDALAADAPGLDPFDDDGSAAETTTLFSANPVELWSDTELSWVDELGAAELDDLAAALSALEAG